MMPMLGEDRDPLGRYRSTIDRRYHPRDISDMLVHPRRLRKGI